MRTVLALLLSLLTIPSHAAMMLQYHHIGEQTPRVTSATLAEFKSHIEYVQSLGFTIISLPDMLTAIEHGTLDPKSVVITFDDGYNNILPATDWLAEQKLSYTVFVNPQLIDQKASFSLNWPQLRDLAKQGAVIANHSLKHDYLPERTPNETTAQWQARVSNDIQQAEQRIVDEVGQNHKILAYPYGEFDKDLQQLVKDLGFVGVGQHSGGISQFSDLTRLPRFPASGSYADLNTLKAKIKTLGFQYQSELPNPVTEHNKPTLTLKIAMDDFSKSQLACYVSGQGKTEVQWLDDQTFSLTATKPLPQGRSRYNCTAPSMKLKGFYYWFSQPWIFRTKS